MNFNKEAKASHEKYIDNLKKHYPTKKWVDPKDEPLRDWWGLGTSIYFVLILVVGGVVTYLNYNANITLNSNPNSFYVISSITVLVMLGLLIWLVKGVKAYHMTEINEPWKHLDY